MNHPLHTSKKFNIHLDLEARVELVLAAHVIHGHVSRKTLMTIYGISQLQAGALMRDFIKTHPNNIEWVAKHAHYTYSTDLKSPS